MLSQQSNPSCKSDDVPLRIPAGLRRPWGGRGRAAQSRGAETRSCRAQQKGARAAFVLCPQPNCSLRAQVCVSLTQSSALCSLPGPSEETFGETKAERTGRAVRTEICKATNRGAFNKGASSRACCLSSFWRGVCLPSVLPVCPWAPQRVGMGQGALGTGPCGQGLTGTAQCLLCPLDPLAALPREFFPLPVFTQTAVKTPLPLPEESRAGTANSAPVSTGNTGPPRYLPLPSPTDHLPPRCLSRTPRHSFC